MENATTWRQQSLPTGTTEPTQKIIPQREEALELTRDQTIAGLETFHEMLFQAPEGAIIGPVQVGSTYICFTKEKSLETGSIPLNSVAADIRRILTRDALDKRERVLAAELTKHLVVENHIDYPRYGLPSVEPIPARL